MILNRQRAVRVSIAALDRFLLRARRKLRLPSDSLAICLVTNAQIARWNTAFRGKKGATDVLSFATQGSGGGEGGKGTRGKNVLRPATGRSFKLPESDAGLLKTRGADGFSFASSTSFTSSASYLGDIAIAPAVARRNARRFGRTLNDELRILILHGILHLMGYDHETDNGEMERREQRLRRALGLASGRRGKGSGGKNFLSAV